MKSLPPTPLNASRRGPRAAFALALLLTFGSAYALVGAQTAPPVAGNKALTVEDYTRRRSITGQQISGDGKWVSRIGHIHK